MPVLRNLVVNIVPAIACSSEAFVSDNVSVETGDKCHFSELKQRWSGRRIDPNKYGTIPGDITDIVSSQNRLWVIQRLVGFESADIVADVVWRTRVQNEAIVEDIRCAGKADLRDAMDLRIL